MTSSGFVSSSFNSYCQMSRSDAESELSNISFQNVSDSGNYCVLVRYIDNNTFYAHYLRAGIAFWQSARFADERLRV